MVVKAGDEPIAVDLSRVTAREMGAFFKAAAANDMDALAAFFTRVVTRCPYGEPGEAATFLDLPFFGAFQTVLSAVADAAKKLQSAPSG